uniref:GOLD domain-containing protein n=1 Tax=Canis lupus familiaris TaxID=9615 RepID=A0A8C0RFB1_CANLF
MVVDKAVNQLISFGAFETSKGKREGVMPGQPSPCDGRDFCVAQPERPEFRLRVSAGVQAQVASPRRCSLSTGRRRWRPLCSQALFLQPPSCGAGGGAYCCTRRLVLQGGAVWATVLRAAAATGGGWGVGGGVRAWADPGGPCTPPRLEVQTAPAGPAPCLVQPPWRGADLGRPGGARQPAGQSRERPAAQGRAWQGRGRGVAGAWPARGAGAHAQRGRLGAPPERSGLRLRTRPSAPGSAAAPRPRPARRTAQPPRARDPAGAPEQHGPRGRAVRLRLRLRLHLRLGRAAAAAAAAPGRAAAGRRADLRAARQRPPVFPRGRGPGRPVLPGLPGHHWRPLRRGLLRGGPAGEHNLPRDQEATVYFDFQVGDEPPILPDMGNRVTALTQMESACVTIHEALKTVIDSQTHYRLREAQDRARAEDLNSRVSYWSVGETVALFVVSFSQVLLLKSFFTEKRASPRAVHS